jgi:hypothetical protein
VCATSGGSLDSSLMVYLLKQSPAGRKGERNRIFRPAIHGRQYTSL